MDFLEKDFDILHKFAAYYKQIDKKYKTAFLVVFVINFFTFFIFIAHHPIHNHVLRLPWINPLDQLSNGRWFSAVIFTLFSNANVPVLMPMTTMALYTLSGMLIARMWGGKDISLRQIIVISLFISLYPAVLSSYYFVWLSVVFSSAVLFMLLALYLSSSLSFLSIFYGSVFVLMGFATYQASVSIFATVLVSIIIIKILNMEKENTTLFSIFKHDFLPGFISLIAGAVLYKISLPVFQIRQSYRTATVSLADLPFRLHKVIEQSYRDLRHSYPELLPFMKILLLIVLILAFITLTVKIVKSKNVVLKVFLLTVFYLALIVSTKTVFLISTNNHFHLYRYNPSMAFMYAFALFILLQYWKHPLLKNIAIVLSIFLIVKFSYADLVRQNVILKTQIHDLAMANRILMRIENLPDLNYKKRYTLIRVGSYSSYRNKLYNRRGHHYNKIGWWDHLHVGDISGPWNPACVMRLLGSKVKFRYCASTPNYKALIKDAEKNLIGMRKPWPAAESVFIHKDKIIVVMSNRNLKKKKYTKKKIKKK